MDEKGSYENLQQIFDNIPENFNILEEQIDIDEQLRYFEASGKLRKLESYIPEIPENFNDLYSPDISDEKKQEILVSLALVPDVKAFRIIENYLKKPDKHLRNWALLAYQESRMMLHSSLLDEQQVFISTGLGGKGKKLRYCVVFIYNPFDKMLKSMEQKLLKDELIFALKNEDGEFESIDFSQGFASALLLLPLKIELKEIFEKIIDECNQYGNFLSEDIILTNVKILTRNEIVDFLNSGEGSGNDK